MGETAPAISVTFLGTGSGVPSLERNLACVAVQRRGELLLFDCGEAAQIQYRRAGFGFAPLSAIFISHLHGDHVTGLMGLLMSLQMADRSAPIWLYGPPGLGDYIRCNQRALGTRFSFRINLVESEAGGVLRQERGYRVVAEPLDHRGLCLGFRLEEEERRGRFDEEKARELGVPFGAERGELQQGRPVRLADGREVRPEDVIGPVRPGAVLAYCTDTRPSPAAVRLGWQADILIHEGTFAGEMSLDAHTKGHSTVVEAAEIAVQAGARELILTHLSPRYGDVRPLLDEARAVFPATRIARDLFRAEIHHREE